MITVTTGHGRPTGQHGAQRLPSRHKLQPLMKSLKPLQGRVFVARRQLGRGTHKHAEKRKRPFLLFMTRLRRHDYHCGASGDTYPSQTGLERDVGQTALLFAFRCDFFRGRWWNLTPPQGQLTRARASQQVLALRLVGVDGRDLHVVFRVWVQVVQPVGGLVVVQDGL